MSEKQFYLLQVNDALFPIGGYSHSQGRFGNLGYEILFIGDSFKGRSYQDVVL